MTSSTPPRCDRLDDVALLALQALPAEEAASMHAHVGTCSVCRAELDALRPVVDAFVAYPTDVLRPSRSLWGRLAGRIGKDPGSAPPLPTAHEWPQPQWEEVAPGIQCKLLAVEPERVSMLVRLAPGVAYPPHRHAGVEELHLLDGELWIEDRKLYPGDYNRAEPGTADQRVWSETGCTCVLITSPHDQLG
jgi:hypothetical protein